MKEMASELAMASKKAIKESGGKKVFSVPVGKLRNKTSGHGRSGSCSKSGSKSKYHNKLLMRNNRELAYALSKQKEKTKITIDDNLKLTTLLHESKLKVLGLKKKINGSDKSSFDYRECIKGHLRDAIKYSVSLTESLKLAMSVTYEEVAAPKVLNSSYQRRNEISSGSSSVPPQRHLVNPMVSGHTIRYPTINLKRVNMDHVERMTEEIVTPSSEHGAEVVNMSNSVELSKESVERGLTPCVEEDEEECENETNSTHHEMQEESFRRRTISFRHRTFEKTKHLWELEVDNHCDSNDASKELTKDHSDVDKRTSQLHGVMNSEQAKTSNKWECISVPEGLIKLTPVVALNDVSRYLQKSNSVNVLKMSLDNHKPKAAEKVASAAVFEKENLHAQVPANRTASPESYIQKSTESGPLDNTSKAINSVDEQIEGYRDSLNCNATEADKLIAMSSNEQDPLEGTSWMYKNLHPSKTVESKKGRSQKLLKKTTQRAAKSKKVCKNPSSISNAKKKAECRPSQSISSSHESDSVERNDVISVIDKVDSVTEKNAGLPNVADMQQKDAIESFTRQDDSDLPYSSCNESFQLSFKDVAEINDALKNNLAVQSTPKCSDDKRPTKNCGLQLSITNTLDSLGKSSSDGSVAVSNAHSDSNSSHDKCKVDSEEKSGKKLTIPSVDSKLLGNAFVTVRVKRLITEEPTKESLAGTDNEAENKINGLALTSQSSSYATSNPFLGFDFQEVSLECSNARSMKDGLATINSEQFISRENSRSTVDGSSAAYDSKTSVGIENCDGSAEEYSGRPKRRAAPKELKEPNLNKKLRRDTIGSKKVNKKRK